MPKHSAGQVASVERNRGNISGFGPFVTTGNERDKLQEVVKR